MNKDISLMTQKITGAIIGHPCCNFQEADRMQCQAKDTFISAKLVFIRKRQVKMKMKRENYLWERQVAS
jgi:hypothetical protein